jgi:ribosome-binding protein aMBF1 (putative translation factor)
MNGQSESAREVLGLRVKNERSKLKMNRGMFAEHADVSVGCVACIEHGEIDFQNSEHLKVLRVLRISINVALLPLTKKPRWKRFKLHSNFSNRTRKLPHRNVRESLHR